MVSPLKSVSHPILVQQEHKLIFARDVFDPTSDVLGSVMTPREPGEQVRAVVFWDRGLEKAFPGYGARISAWFSAHAESIHLAAAPVGLEGGERVKNEFAQLERIWRVIESAGLCRHSYVVVVGGGAVLDLVGFAAATAHRGIPLIRLPSTSLSQGDGGVGVKNGVNYFGKKNWLGSFGVPHAVINDLSLLQGLPVRERRAGLVEAVKVALIRDAAFFESIAAQAKELAAFQSDAFERVICESARQHIEHIATAGDPFERGSARPLDFGHWSAHKLEQLSQFELSHGEAVAVGMAMDIVYARRTGLLRREDSDRVLGLMKELGFELYSPLLELRGRSGARLVLDGLEEFREHLGGRLSIPMIRSPGQRLEVHEMDTKCVEASIEELKARHG